MAHLVLNIGITHVSVGTFEGEELTGSWELKTDPLRTSDEWGLLLGALLGNRAIDLLTVASAVPAVLPQLRQLAVKSFPAAESVFVGAGVKTGLQVTVDNPREVGADRVARALAAASLNLGATLIIDVGTATTFDILDGQGRFVGGAIAPGVEIAQEALLAHGPQLREVDLAWPRSVIGRNTVEAIQSGLMFGLLSQLEGMVARVADELGEPPSVVLTGRHSGLATDADFIDVFVPHLTLQGLRIIGERNR